MRHIALAYWGDIHATCDRGVMDIPIIRTSLRPWLVDTDGDGRPDVTIRHNAEFSHDPGDEHDPPFHDCKILIDDQHWSTEYLCRLVVHEMGHAKGWRAPPGQQYQGPFGPEDTHSSDPRSIMWGSELAPFAPCADGAAAVG